MDNAHPIPSNRTAALVVSKGFSEEFVYEDDGVFSSTFIKNGEFADNINDNPDFNDFTGTKFGDLVVKGYYGSQGKKAKWVCKCSCGNYEARTTKSIKRGIINNRGICQECHALESIQHLEYKRLNGHWPQTLSYDRRHG